MKSKIIAAAFGAVGAVCIGALALFFMPPSPSETRLLFYPSQLTVTDGPPADYSSAIFGATWDHVVDYAENEPVDCSTDAAADASQCLAVLRVNAPRNATHAMLKIKAKAWVLSGPSDALLNYGLIYARAPIDGHSANHFIHVETWGGGPDGKEERRRVEYSDVIVPIVNGTVTLEIGKQVSGKSLVEFLVYVSGYVTTEPNETELLSQLQ
jgi:hypothetical protein